MSPRDRTAPTVKDARATLRVGKNCFIRILRRLKVGYTFARKRFRNTWSFSVVVCSLSSSSFFYRCNFVMDVWGKNMVFVERLNMGNLPLWLLAYHYCLQHTWFRMFAIGREMLANVYQLNRINSLSWSTRTNKHTCTYKKVHSSMYFTRCFEKESEKHHSNNFLFSRHECLAILIQIWANTIHSMWLVVTFSCGSRGKCD